MFKIEKSKYVSKPQVVASFMLPWLVNRRFENGEITKEQRDHGMKIIKETWDKYYGD